MIKSLLNMSMFALEQTDNKDDSSPTTCLKSVITNIRGKSSSLENSELNISILNEINTILNSENGVDVCELRKCLLKKGVPDFSGEHNTFHRYQIWKILLGVPCAYDSEAYTAKIEGCPGPLRDKVIQDTFRTFKGNDGFWSKVDVASLTRVLCAIATDHGYVQGMNVLLGPMAYIMSELDCYYCMKTLITTHMPSYVLKNLDGVHVGVRLFGQVLSILDHKLHTHIMAKATDLVTVMSFPYIMSLMANTQPLEAVLRLWDVIFAFGVHLNVVLLCVHLMVIRDKILKVNSGSKILRVISETPLDSEVLIPGALTMIQFIPEELFEEMMMHPLLPIADK